MGLSMSAFWVQFLASGRVSGHADSESCSLSSQGALLGQHEQMIRALYDSNLTLTNLVTEMYQLLSSGALPTPCLISTWW